MTKEELIEKLEAYELCVEETIDGDDCVVFPYDPIDLSKLIDEYNKAEDCNHEEIWQVLDDFQIRSYNEDEILRCGDCGRVIPTDGYGKPDYAITEYDVFCKDCIENHIEGYIDHLTNNPDSANRFLTDAQLMDLGWGIAERELECGYYGTYISPASMLKKYKKYDVLFSIDHENPFETTYNVWVKGGLIRKYEVILYDVWGNSNDGYDINEKFHTGKFVELGDKATDEEIVDMLHDDFDLPDVRLDDSNEGVIYIEDARTGEPLMELEVVK